MAALFFDVDGTLIDSYHENRSISPVVRAELARVQALGHMIFLSSGRSRMLLTPALLEPGFDGLVLINGGYVEMDGESSSRSAWTSSWHTRPSPFSRIRVRVPDHGRASHLHAGVMPRALWLL